MSFIHSYSIFPLGDSALTIDFGSTIDPIINQRVIALFQHLQQNPIKGIIETVPAYSSLTVYYDVMTLRKIINDNNSVYDWVKEQIQARLQNDSISSTREPRFMKIPVCYEKEFAPDLQWIAEQKRLSSSEIISLHVGKKYRVYMIGFLPGFAYMGELDGQIEIPRKLQPRQVEAGSVGIAGKQTGIYPLSSPGGWQIIGHTPMKLFDVTKGDPVILRMGDEVQFYPITEEEFLYLKQ